MINFIFILGISFSAISSRQINAPHGKLLFECNFDNPCPDGRTCVLGVCRDVKVLKKCPVFCPETEMTYHQVCGSDGWTYNSSCFLEKLNCETGAETLVQCHQKCPCNEGDFYSKSICNTDAVKAKLNAYFHQISSKDFSNLLNSSKSPPMLFMEYVKQPCQYSTKWAFAALDFDTSGFVEKNEQAALKETFNDECVNMFIDNCDANENQMLSFNEFCYCLKYHSPPCYKALDAVPVTVNPEISSRKSLGETGGSPMGQFVNGSYVPMCDESGYFLPTQSFRDSLWCVDDFGDLIVDTWMYNPGATECYEELVLSSYFPLEI